MDIKTFMLILEKYLKPNIKRLRQQYPNIVWKTERTGFGGVRYVGYDSKGVQTIVQAHAVIVDEDVFHTRWYIITNGHSQPYNVF